MWKNTVGPGRPQITIWHMRIACWIPQATNTHSESEILIAFPLQQWLHVHHSTLHYIDMACHVRYFCNATYIPIYFIVLENTRYHFSQIGDIFRSYYPLKCVQILSLITRILFSR